MTLRSSFSFLMRGLVVRPFRHAANLRRDDDGQVMLITGVFVFIVAVATITSLNSSELLFNRIRTQNAADAAADAFALWQARAFNVNQHLNDYHIEKNIEFFGRTLASCMKRFINIGPGSACQKQWRPARCAGCTRVNQDGNVGAVRNCCQAINTELSQVETEQAMISNLVLAMQGIIDFVAPQMGWLAANEVAKGSGASRISGNNDLQDKIEETLRELEVPGYDITAILGDFLAPSPDVYVVPLRSPILEMLPLPTGAMGNPITAIPPWSVGGPTGGRCLFSPLNDVSCMISTCGEGGAMFCFIYGLIGGMVPAFIDNLIGPSDGCASCFLDFAIFPRYFGFCATSTCISFYSGWCQFPLQDLNECNYGCTGAAVDFFSTAPGQTCGWHDTFYAGVPLAYTWITGKEPRTLGNLNIYDDSRWFNPRFRSLTADEGGDFDTEDLFYANSDDFEFEAEDAVADRSNDYRNARFMAMASCTARGDKDGNQPLTMWSDLSKAAGPFGYSRPQIINVHLEPLGTSDTSADDHIIWH